MARVFLARSARDALAALDFLLADAVLDALGELERDPDAGYELRGRLSGLWSYRVGVYRIIYERRDPRTIRVVAIRHRGQAYETDPLGQLRGLRAVDRQLDVWQRETIARARQQGASWSEIGDALGVSKQAAWKLYNDDVREMLADVRNRSGLSDEEAQQLADRSVVRARGVPSAGR